MLARSGFKQGEGFHGSVFILAGYDRRSMIFPVGCGGGVTADLPEDVALPGYRGTDFSVPPERLFYEAWVEGKMEGTAFGRPSVRLTRVVDPQQKAPRWLAGNTPSHQIATVTQRAPNIHAALPCAPQPSPISGLSPETPIRFAS